MTGRRAFLEAVGMTPAPGEPPTSRREALAVAAGAVVILAAILVSGDQPSQTSPPAAETTTTTEPARVLRSPEELAELDLAPYQEELLASLQAQLARHADDSSPEAAGSSTESALRDTAPAVAALPEAVPSTTTPTPAPPPRWTPESECRRIRNPGPVRLTSATLRWCARVAYYLDLGERRGAWTWEPGDLHRLLLIIECESNGNPAAVNRSSGTTGLFQHRPRYWSDRGAKAAAVLGFKNPTLTMPYDNIAVGVWLYKVGGRSHWQSCAGWWSQTASARAVRATLANLGLTP